MKIRPISDAEIAKMMSEETVLYRKPGAVFPNHEPVNVMIPNMILAAKMPFERQRHFWDFVIEHDILPVCKLFDCDRGTPDRRLVALVVVCAKNEYDWYDIFDALYDAFGKVFDLNERHVVPPPPAKVEPRYIYKYTMETVYTISPEHYEKIKDARLDPEMVYRCADLFEYLREMVASEWKEGEDGK